MPKTYWASAYRAVKDADKLAAYAKLAGPALTAGGGRFLARSEPAKVYEHGLKQRTVLLEFDSVEQAVAAYDSPAYQAALDALGDGAERGNTHHRRRLSFTGFASIALPANLIC
jgi:uncharacterized protein (DUF1330 family)